MYLDSVQQSVYGHVLRAHFVDRKNQLNSRTAHTE